MAGNTYVYAPGALIFRLGRVDAPSALTFRLGDSIPGRFILFNLPFILFCVNTFLQFKIWNNFYCLETEIKQYYDNNYFSLFSSNIPAKNLTDPLDFKSDQIP